MYLDDDSKQFVNMVNYAGGGGGSTRSWQWFYIFSIRMNKIVAFWTGFVNQY